MGSELLERARELRSTIEAGGAAAAADGADALPQETVDACFEAGLYAAHEFTEITSGHAHSCALQADGIAQRWGWNEFGQADPPS